MEHSITKTCIYDYITIRACLNGYGKRYYFETRERKMATEPPYESWESRPTKECRRAAYRAKGGREHKQELEEIVRAHNA
jgi:hypothetical protein